MMSFSFYSVCLQHDCQEFLALLLDSLHEQLNKVSVPFVQQRTLNNRLPTLEDLLMKDNKTLNTNVLVEADTATVTVSSYF